jgi:hypothetical protein
MKRRWLWITGGLILVAAFVLLPRSAPVNPPFNPLEDLLATNPPPAEIASLLRAACYDCHSDQTRWPWYSRVAPISVWLASHVEQGRERLNFSDWPHDDPARAAKKCRRIAEEVRSGDMPLPSYTWAHPAARLSRAQRDELAKWAEAQARGLQPNSKD